MAVGGAQKGHLDVEGDPVLAVVHVLAELPHAAVKRDEGVPCPSLRQQASCGDADAMPPHTYLVLFDENPIRFLVSEVTRAVKLDVV